MGHHFLGHVLAKSDLILKRSKISLFQNLNEGQLKPKRVEFNFATLHPHPQKRIKIGFPVPSSTKDTLIQAFPHTILNFLPIAFHKFGPAFEGP